MIARKALAFTLVVLMVMTIFSIFGCPVVPPAEFNGTWQGPLVPDTLTLEFTNTAMALSITGVTNGSMTMTINSYDETVNHIRTTTTSVQGDLTGDFAVGGVLFWTYEIIGSQLFYSFDELGLNYPANATTGPFDKQ